MMQIFISLILNVSPPKMVPFMIKKIKKNFEEKILIFIGSSSAAKLVKM
jgi:hypothetical protein